MWRWVEELGESGNRVTGFPQSTRVWKGGKYNEIEKHRAVCGWMKSNCREDSWPEGLPFFSSNNI